MLSIRCPRLWGLISGLFVLALAAAPIKADDLCSPCWDKKINNARERFKVLTQFNSEAVLDRETQLVWARQSGAPTDPDLPQDWDSALIECYAARIGGRGGWRLPSVEELASLVDMSQSNPALPVGHPFMNVHSAPYWTATTRVGLTEFAWNVDLASGLSGNTALKRDVSFFTWCVRGGQGFVWAQ